MLHFPCVLSNATQDASTHAHPFNGPFSGTTRLSQYQKGKTNLDFTEARASELQWHQLGHMQICTSLQTDNHASTTPLKFFLQAGCPSCRPTNSVKALKARCKISLKLLPHILFQNFVNILALETASPGNRHCAYCIGAL